MSILLQRAILGVESYLPAALKFASAQLGIASSELFRKLNNPFSFAGRTTASKLYHQMPSAVHPELSLQYLNQKHYDRNLSFYKLVRNPLFHGQQLQEPSIVSLRLAFDHLAITYEWIDRWHDPELRIPGGRSLANVRNRYPLIVDPNGVF